MYLIYQEDKLGRTILELVFKNTGSIYAKDGVANFLAHMLNTKGTLKEKENFYKTLEEKAINLQVTLNKEYTTISTVFLNEKSNIAIKNLINLLKNPNFSYEAFSKSKNEIKAKKKSLQNNNDYIASKNLFKVMFKNTPLEREVIGENIDDISLEDIKNHFSYFSKENIVFINGGKKIEIEPFLEVLNNKKPKNELVFNPTSGEIVEKKEVEQSYIYFGAPFDVKKDEFYLAKITTFILGAGGFGSRMMEEIRVKRGYAYSAYAMNDFKRSYKILRGYLQTKLENTEDAINLVKELINNFSTKGITQEELDSAKKFLLGSEPLRNETLSQRLLKKFNEYYLDLKEGYFEKELKLIEKASLDEVNEFIKRHNEINNLSFSIVTK